MERKQRRVEGGLPRALSQGAWVEGGLGKCERTGGPPLRSLFLIRPHRIIEMEEGGNGSNIVS